MASLLVVPGGDACAGPAPRLSVGRSLRPQLGELTGGLVPALDAAPRPDGFAAHERAPSLRARGGDERRRARAGARRRASDGQADIGRRSPCALGTSSAAFEDSSAAFDDRS